MDIEIFGIKMSSFIKAFKKNYSLGNENYDYMSFLESTDCASYCAMKQSYENPNSVLNLLINTELNNIDVIGGKKKMRGGSPQTYIFILLLFLLAVSNVFAGPAYDELVRQFGTDPSKWPKSPGPRPIEPQNRWNGFIFTLGPSPQAMANFNAELAKWNDNTDRYEFFLGLQKNYIGEYEQQQQLKQAQINVDQTMANAEYTRSKAAETSSLALYEAFNRLSEYAEQNAKFREENALLKGLLMGGGSILGLLFLYVGYMSNARRYPEIDYQQPAYHSSQEYPPVGAYPLEYLEKQRLLKGGKTKNYRKKRTTKRRH